MHLPSSSLVIGEGLMLTHNVFFVWVVFCFFSLSLSFPLVISVAVPMGIVILVLIVMVATLLFVIYYMHERKSKLGRSTYVDACASQYLIVTCYFCHNSTT